MNLPERTQEVAAALDIYAFVFVHCMGLINITCIGAVRNPGIRGNIKQAGSASAAPARRRHVKGAPAAF